MKPILLKDLGLRVYANRNRRYGLYRCPYCTNTFESLSSTVNAGDKKTCGCKTNELKNKTTHDLSNHKLYKVWSSIKQRCNNEKCEGFKNYGGRGISICKEWSLDFKSFFDWCMKNGYKDGLTIDRRNNDGNYEPSNCRFATYQIQNCNKLYEATGSGYIGIENRDPLFIASLSVNDSKRHIGTFKTPLEAALARDLYILDNNLNNKRNFNSKDNENVTKN